MNETETREVPPREWFEERFVHDGEVRYCSECFAIPFLFIGHFCTGIEGMMCGIRAERVSVPYRWEDVLPVENEDRPGEWKLVWVAAVPSSGGGTK